MIIKPEELKIVYEKEDDGSIRPVYFIDAEPVRQGRWIDMKYNQQWFKEEFKCSECGEFMLGMTNYCPNCGAKMKGEENG